MSKSSKKLRDLVYAKYNGHCAYCGNELNGKMHQDHIIPVDRLGKKGLKEREKALTTLDNLNPSCPRCNLWKHSWPLESFKDNIANLIGSLKRDSPQFRMALDYGLIEFTGKSVEFYFETQQKEER